MDRTVNRTINCYERLNSDLKRIRQEADESMSDWLLDRIVESDSTILMLKSL